MLTCISHNNHYAIPFHINILSDRWIRDGFYYQLQRAENVTDADSIYASKECEIKISYRPIIAPYPTNNTINGIAEDLFDIT